MLVWKLKCKIILSLGLNCQTDSLGNWFGSSFFQLQLVLINLIEQFIANAPVMSEKKKKKMVNWNEVQEA